MKKNTIVLSLCGLVGCALSANAAIDITVNGTTYAITTVSYQGTLTPGLFNSLTSQVWYNVYGPNAAYNFDVAYINAVLASDPNAGTDGAEQAADNTEFVRTLFTSSYANATSASTVYDIQGLIDSGTTLNSNVTEPLILAEATVVAVPENATYGVAAACMLVGFLGVSTLRQTRKNLAA